MAETPQSIPNFQAGLRLIDGTDLNKLVHVCNYLYLNAGAPSNGPTGTGADICPPGSLLIDYTNKTTYQNTGTLLSPTWTIFESSGGGGIFTTIHATGAVTFDTTALVKGVLTVGVKGTTAGEVDLQSPTLAKGQLIVKAADSAGDTNTTLTNASMGQATVITLPDPGGATGTVALLEGAQTVSGVKTFGANPTFSTGNTLKANVQTATLSSNAATLTHYAAQITTESLTTAAGASQALVLTLTGMAATDIAVVTRAGGTNTRHNFQLDAVATSNTLTVTVFNTEPTNALNGTIIFNVWIFKA